jgi:obscurin-RhoGEF protein
LRTELPPEFVRPLQNVEINEGEVAVFECELNIDNTTAKWYHDGREITDNRRYNPVREGKVHRLIITDAILPDAGDITAKVEDKSTTAHLTVHG